MADFRTNWADRDDSKPDSYIVDGVPKTVLKDDSGLVTPGTNVNSSALNNLEERTTFTLKDTTNTNDYSGTITGLTLFDGLKLHLEVTNPNTGPVTIDIGDGNGAKGGKFINAQGNKVDIPEGQLFGINKFKYDGVDWILSQKYLKKPIVNVEEFGAVGDGIVDDTTAINNAIQSGKTIYFPKPVYKVTDELLFSHGQAIIAPNGVTIDGTNFVGTSGNSVLKVTNEGNNYSALPLLSQDVVKDTQDLFFDSPHGLVIGDIVCLYDNASFSYSSARESYKKSEFAKVSRIISPTQVEVDSPFYDNYDATTNGNFSVVKMNMGTFNIIGSLKVIQGKAGTFYGCYFERLKHSNVGKIESYALNGSYTATLFRECFDVAHDGTAIQETLSGSGGDYGLSIANCQHFKYDGYFSASRHGVTIGGFDGIGAIIGRDIQGSGTIKTTNEGSVQAYDLHGNVEDIKFEGVVYGGITIGGKSTVTKGIIHGDNRGLCVISAEIIGFNHDLSGCKFITSKDPFDLAGGRGVVDFGGDGQVDEDNMLNGTFDLSNITIDAPNAQRGVDIRTRNITGSLIGLKNIKLNNATIKCVEDNVTTIFISDDSGVKNFDNVYLDNLSINSSTYGSINDTDNLVMPKEKGVEPITLSATNLITQRVNLNKTFPSSTLPRVSLSIDGVAVQGGNVVITTVSNVTNSYFDIVLTTNDGANFQTTNTLNVLWEVS